ncbi:SHOCT domain-containing protein [Nocardioides koreensis]|uniref:SHOCT domain-containing protein n=1 Tax=Nocardioides koreensis TaxID=433651 RepID=A0ABP5LHR4_9ACTN
MMGWDYGTPGWGGWLVMTVIMLVFWGGVIFALVAMFRGFGSGGSWGGPTGESRNPLQILDERFARGEIDEQEYDARREALRQAGNHRVR